MPRARIAIMGATGSGKSEFVKLVTGRDDIPIGKTYDSCTAKVEAYNLQIGGIDLDILDTPGFNDRQRDDYQILKEIVAFLQSLPQHDNKLNGIIYLHSASKNRMEGSAKLNLELLKALIGESFYGNLVLALSMWTTVDPMERDSQLQELVSNKSFWGDMVGKQSKPMLLPFTREEGCQLLLVLASGPAHLLQIQQELKSKIPIELTSAARPISHIAQLNAIKEQGTVAALAELEQRGQLLKAIEKNTLEKFEAETIRQNLLQLEYPKRQHRQRKQNIETDFERSLQKWHYLDALRRGLSQSRYNFSHVDMFSMTLCGLCSSPIYASVSYVCYECVIPGKELERRLDICGTCFAEGKRCYDVDHRPLAKRRAFPVGNKKCTLLYGKASREWRMTCSTCYQAIGALFFHCCICDNDNYNLCGLCAKKGNACRDKSHVLLALSM